jgi:hypothetical protein
VDENAKALQDGDIIHLADSILDEKERELAEHLAKLLDNDRFDAASLIVEILLKYWREDNTEQTLEPREVYRPLYYLHGWGEFAERHFKRITRSYIEMAFQHLEGCLSWLSRITPQVPRSLSSKPFGVLVRGLEKSEALPSKLAEQLSAFNSIANVPAKHMKAALLNSELDKRTFSVIDASLSLIIMRKLSMQMFQLLQAQRVVIPAMWKVLNEDWLTWKRPA